jgi:FAD-NAD(P)-binding
MTPDWKTAMDIAIVGMGPRGLSVLERLLAQLSNRPTAVRTRIWAFDPGEHGAGRIWRTTQPDWFIMNTPAGEVSLYSDCPDGGPARAAAGPSLAEWLRQHPDRRWASLGPDDYAPRAVYGQYLRSVFESLTAHAPANVSVIPVKARIIRIEHYGDKRMLVCDQGKYVLAADKVVLATGHPHNLPSPLEQQLLGFAAAHNLRYLRSESAADLTLDRIAPGEQVGIIGLGLSFFDVLTALTVGRGGEFRPGADGMLRYVPSGREPRISAGSRSGLLMPARGRNQKEPRYRYQPVFVTEPAITAARRRAQRRDGSAQLSFIRDVLPLLHLEVEHVYYTCQVRRRHGVRAAARFAARHLELAGHERDALAKLLSDFGIAEVPPISLEKLARPFQARNFSDPESFHTHLLDLLRADVAEATEGNVDGPLKAALDILRDIRGTVRLAVDYGGLQSDSHRDEFLSWFNPIYAMVAAGPPHIRVDQAGALIRSAVLTVVGPDTQVSCDPGSGQFVLESGQVHGSRRSVTTLIDARIPRADLPRDAGPLIRQLLADGLISEYVNTDPVNGTRFPTGGLAVTRAPFHVIDRAGKADPHMYAIGIPTENIRWFNQAGNGRPGPLTAFHADADAIAAAALGLNDAASRMARGSGATAPAAGPDPCGPPGGRSQTATRH